MSPSREVYYWSAEVTRVTQALPEQWEPNAGWWGLLEARRKCGCAKSPALFPGHTYYALPGLALVLCDVILGFLDTLFFCNLQTDPSIQLPRASLKVSPVHRQPRFPIRLPMPDFCPLSSPASMGSLSSCESGSLVLFDSHLQKATLLTFSHIWTSNFCISIS